MLTPRWYQEQANACVWQYFKDSPGKNPLVVLPTGAGKSLVIAMMIKQAVEFGGRVVVLAHRKELLRQNADEIMDLIPDIDVGIYSAGMKKREIHNQVVVAGIQSVFQKGKDLGRRHLIIVDEAHLISEIEDSMYGKFIGYMRLQKGMRVCGLTATPFRTGSGPLCGPDKLFSRIVFEAKTSQLIDEEYLCPITNKSADNSVNTDKVGIRNGEFIESEMQAVFDGNEDVVHKACVEAVSKCQDRHSILVFSTGVNHARNVAAKIEELTGERAGVVVGDTIDLERSALLNDFKNQKLRWLVNCDVLTTGFNARCIDAIVVLRSTMSPGLFAQIIGRGLRTDDSKKEGCRILDFGGNIARHGSIDDDDYGYSDNSGSGGKREAVAENNGRGKKCPSCDIDVPANTRVCSGCGYEFPVGHDDTADESSRLTGKAKPETWIVKDVFFKRHEKKPTPDYPYPPPTLRVDYLCERKDGEKSAGNLTSKTISEWICPEHEGYAQEKFCGWWNCRSITDPPDSVNDAVYLLKSGACRNPAEITTIPDGKYTKIKKYDFGVNVMPIKLREPEAPVSEFSGADDDVPF